MSSLPFYPIPTWLDPAKEIRQPNQPENFSSLKNKDKSLAFILAGIKCLVNETSLNLSFQQILEVVANSVVETGWGEHWRCWNFGGIKLRKDYVDSYKASHNGECPLWWRADGHIKSGDAPVVYYRAFESPQDFYKFWMRNYVPKDREKNYRYYKTGQVFWSGNSEWFLELCLAGYKGNVTAANPDRSVANHKIIVQTMKNMFAQFILGLTYDGRWGPKSMDACKKFQKLNNIEENGILNTATLLLLIIKWKNEGMKNIVNI